MIDPCEGQYRSATGTREQKEISLRSKLKNVKMFGELILKIYYS